MYLKRKRKKEATETAGEKTKKKNSPHQHPQPCQKTVPKPINTTITAQTPAEASKTPVNPTTSII